MEHLPQGVKDVEGCFVYQVCNGGSIDVRSDINVRDESRIEGRNFKNGELLSMDLVRWSRVDGSKNGPFLRLSDTSGWMFEKKYGNVKIPVTVGLWTFYVDNGQTGIGLRRHPIDRRDMLIEGIVYQPMQKIHCDRKVQHPSTGINFYRVQGTEGWVFDRRLSTTQGGADTYMLLNENMVETGVFVYQCIRTNGIGIRATPDTKDESRTNLSIEEGKLILADVIRKSPFPHGNGPFLRLSDGSGWLFEKKRHEQGMQRLLVNKGKWVLKVMNSPNGIALRRLPNDSKNLRETSVFLPGEEIRCTHMVQAGNGVKFYRVSGTEGWVFDKRGDREMTTVVSYKPASQNGSDFSNGVNVRGWDPNDVRAIAAAEGATEISSNEQSRVISFRSNAAGGARINIYYTTQTVGTALSHPSQGATQLFRRNCTYMELANVFQNPRVHTGKGYKRKRDETSGLEIILTPYGRGFLVDKEIDDRNALLEIEEQIAELHSKKRHILMRIRETDLHRAKEANAMKYKMKKY